MAAATLQYSVNELSFTSVAPTSSSVFTDNLNTYSFLISNADLDCRPTLQMRDILLPNAVPADTAELPATNKITGMSKSMSAILGSLMVPLIVCSLPYLIYRSNRFRFG